MYNLFDLIDHSWIILHNNNNVSLGGVSVEVGEKVASHRKKYCHPRATDLLYEKSHTQEKTLTL